MDNSEIEHIVSDIKQGKTERFALLVDEYKHMVYALCLKMTNSKEDAEEVAQDTFVKAFLGIKRFKGKSKFSTWLYQIAYFSSIGHLRKKKHHHSNDLEIDVTDTNSDVFSNLIQTEREIKLKEALKFLNPDERAIISLFYLDAFSIKDIAKITKLSESNVKVKVHRIKKKLHNILSASLKNEVHSLI